MSIPATGDPADLTGGIGLRVGINRPNADWPRFSSLRVVGIDGGPREVSGFQQPVSDAVLLDPNARWLSAPGVAAPVRVSRGELAPEGRTLSVYAAYQPDQTARWDDYVLTGTIDRLTNTQVSGALWVRVGSPLAISVRVYRDHLDIYSGDADNQTLVATRPLNAAPTHALSITVTASSTLVSVDGSTGVSLIAKGETGGVGFSAYRDLIRSSWPTVRGMKVTALGGES